MAMTEADAMKRRCHRDLSGTCVGSMCMAWQWLDQTYHRNTELWSKSKNKRVHGAFSDDAEWRPVAGEPTEVPADRGFCGLIMMAPTP